MQMAYYRGYLKLKTMSLNKIYPRNEKGDS